MKKIGITGNIGSGKSFVCQTFKNIGIPIFYSDEETKSLYLIPENKRIIINRFGEDIYYDNGSLNKRRLSQILFNDETELKFIEGLLYPELNKCFESWCERQNAPYVLFESALIFEKEIDILFDKIIFISAPEEVRRQRVMLRDKCNEESFLSRARLQQQEELNIDKADFVIINDGKSDIMSQVKSIDSQLKAL
ncbi:MAG: dephospho-CoA kinase [Candidatus Limimorpha sp.]